MVTHYLFGAICPTPLAKAICTPLLCVDMIFHHQGLQKVTDLELEVSQLRETLTATNTEVTRLKFKEKELEQTQAR